MVFQKEMCNLVLSVVPVVKSKSDPADVACTEVWHSLRGHAVVFNVHVKF